MMRQFSLILPNIVYLLSHLAGASTNGLVLFNRKLYVRPSVTVPPLPVTAGTNNNDPVKDFCHPIGSYKPSLQRSTVCLEPAIPSRTVAKNVLLSAVALRLSPFGSSLSPRGIAASILLFATPVHGAWGGQCASGYLDVTCATDDCCWGTYCSSDNKCNTGHSGNHETVCNGTPNSNIIGCGACCGYQTCDGLDKSTVIGPYSCHGSNACQGLIGSVAQLSCIGTLSCQYVKQGSIGQQSCVGTEACYNFKGSIGQQSCVGKYACPRKFENPPSVTIGDNSCNYEHACDINGLYSFNFIGDNSCNAYNGCLNALDSTIGSSSCNSDGQYVCWYCQNSNVPSNECNTIPNGWDDGFGYYNYCIYCSNCKNQATGQSCYVSVLPATVNAHHTSTIKIGTDCSNLKETMTNFFMSLEDDALKKLIGKYVKSEIEKHPNLCTIKLALMFEHLNQEELQPSCDALQTVFSEHVEEFKNINPGFTDMTFSCEPNDQNANKGKDTKKAKKRKNKKSKTSGNKKRERILQRSKALAPQSDAHSP